MLQYFYYSTFHPWISWSLIQVSLLPFYQTTEVRQLLFDWWKWIRYMTWLCIFQIHTVIWILRWTTNKIFLSGSFLLASVLKNILYPTIKSRRLLPWKWFPPLQELLSRYFFFTPRVEEGVEETFGDYWYNIASTFINAFFMISRQIQ